MGTKSELVGPTSGQKCYITPAFSGVPNKGDKIKVGPQVGGNATSPLHSRGSPMKGEQNQNWMPNPCLLGGPQVGGNATSPLHSRGSPKKGGQNQNWMPNPCLLGGPQVGGNATSTLHSGGSPTKGTKSKQKKSKKNKNKNKNCPMVYPILPTALQIAPTGICTVDLQLQRHCFTTRVWPRSDILLHRGGIDILPNLVLIHYWVLLKKLSILSIDTWGGNPFFHPLLSQAEFA